MAYGSAPARNALAAWLQDRAEEWIYKLNEHDHWIFHLYAWGNEVWARLVFSTTRTEAARIDRPIRTDSGEARFRFLTPADLDRFAALLERMRTLPHKPPHPLDLDAAARALDRRSNLPFGIFVGDDLVGYLLLRLFFPRRAVLGIWMPASRHNARLGRQAVDLASDFMRSRSLANFITVPIDNTSSLRVAEICGYRLLRTNRRFHVLWIPPR